jgi:hypothetical protein
MMQKPVQHLAGGIEARADPPPHDLHGNPAAFAVVLERRMTAPTGDLS